MGILRYAYIYLGILMKEITTIKLTKKTVELLNKLKIHPRQAYEEVVLELLKKARLDKKTNKKGHFDISQFIFLLIIGMIVTLGLFFIEGGITGQVIFSEKSYTQQLDLEVDKSSEYLWVLEKPGELKNIRLSGFFEQDTSARVYIEHNNRKYLILNISELEKKEFPITGLAVKEDKKIKNKSKVKKTANITQSVNRTISLNLEYKSGSFYDTNDDGVETLTGIVDLTVENSEFNWEVNEENLCTRWDTYSIENDESTIVCYGSSKCCEFVDSLSTRSNWNEPFYSAYGQYGATSDNIVSAQVLYIDYNLSLTEPYAEIYYSDWDNLSVNYHAPTINFENICIETCSLENFNESEYRLIFEVDYGFLRIEEIAYSTELIRELNITPINITGLVLVNNVPNMNIVKNNDATIDLSNYFSNIDNAVFVYHEQENIEIIFDNNIATIIPDKDFIGTRFTYITANKSNNLVVSNVFSINVLEKEACFIPSTTEVNYISSSVTFCSGIYNFSSFDQRPLLVNASDIVIDCNDATLIGGNDSDGFYDSFDEPGFENISFTNITIKNCIAFDYDPNSFVYGIFNDSTFENNIITRGGWAFNLYGSNIVIKNNIFDGTEFAVSLGGRYTSNLVIDNNTIHCVDYGKYRGCLVDYGGYGKDIQYQNIVIKNNRIYSENDKLFPILITGADNLVENNYIEGVWETGILLESDTYNTTIRNNILNLTKAGRETYSIFENYRSGKDNILSNNEILGTDYNYSKLIRRDIKTNIRYDAKTGGKIK